MFHGGRRREDDVRSGGHPIRAGACGIEDRGSFIVVRQDGIWKIPHFQNTTVDPDAEHNDPVTWDSRGFVPGGYDS